MSGAPQLIIHKATMKYGQHTAVSNVSLTVHRGEYWLIVGENGSGKSTLLKGLLGLWPLSSGRIERAPGAVGYVPQTSGIDPGFPASVLEVVRSGCVVPFGLVYRASEKRRAAEALRRMNVEMLAKRSFHKLSGGQKQRVLIARALCAASDLLVLDEPDAGLDPVVSQSLYAAIAELNRQGMTIVLVSHHPEAVMEDATGILHLGHGVLFCGTPEEYRAHQASRGFAAP